MKFDELVSSRQPELVHQYNHEAVKPVRMVIWYPDGSGRKVDKKTDKNTKIGRPRVYNGTHRRIIAAALKRYGLTKGMKFLAKERKLKISLTTARFVAVEYGIKFERGRPAAA